MRRVWVGVWVGIAAVACAALPAPAQRRPVLPQIDLPHPYYYRELYLPQLTSGPGSVAWSPDGREVVYSMGGSLWRQAVDSSTATQLTDGPGYDYQPDWSPDGRRIVYCTYAHDALELWLLDLPSGTRHALTNGGAVNVEPRWSPDGKRIAWVSTSYHKRFHIFAANVAGDHLEGAERLTGETRSPLPRYYYSAFDTEISPVWTRDGKEILFVSNRGHIYGTGGFWRMAARPGATAREIHYEETSWKARPDFSPDGSRLVYSSYLGGSWQQLWVLPANGGDAFPLSYGDWDNTNVRWSPGGKQLAFISNRHGNTELWLATMPGGQQRELKAERLVYLRPHSLLTVRVTDAKSALTPARISVTGADGRFYAPASVWISADDGFDPGKLPFEAHYFHSPGQARIEVPAGKITIYAMKGFALKPAQATIEIPEGANEAVTLQLEPLAGWDASHWISSDLHVHMNYAGTYRNTSANLVQQAEAEGLDIVNNLVVNKEQRFPDIASEGGQLDPASRSDALIVDGQEFHTSYWGHLGLLDIRGHILLPGYAGYPNTAAASLYPTNADVADMAHAQGALVGYVHPFDEAPDPFAQPPQTITDELPVDVALGKVDYIEVVGFSDHRATASIWYRLLNLGYRLPTGAGTDAMANYASLRGPVGMDRVFARSSGGPLSEDSLLAALKAGRTFATNGPLLDFTLDGEQPGGTLKLDSAQPAEAFHATLRSVAPVDHLEVVCNGKVAATLQLDGSRESADVDGTVPLTESGWCVLRASSDAAEYPVLDNYVYATTSPVYVSLAGRRARSPEDAKFFVAWIDRMIATTSQYPDWNSAAEKQGVLEQLRRAQEIFRSME